MSPNRQQHLPNRAFTFLELLAVMIVLSIMLVTATSAIRALGTSARQTASQTLLAALDSARAEAVKRNEPWPILFRQGSEFNSSGSFSEYGILQVVGGSEPENRHVAWRSLPRGAWIYGGMITSLSQGTNLLADAKTKLADNGVNAAKQELASEVNALVFGEMGEVSFPNSTSGPYYLAIAEGNPDAMGGKPTKTPDLIEIRPATGRCQLISP